MADIKAAEDYLQTYWSAIADIRRHQEELEELKDINVGLDKDSKQEHVMSSGTADTVGDLASEIADKEEVIYEMMWDAADILTAVTKTIDKVSDATMRLLLTLRYIRRMHWNDIADEIHYSPSKTYEIRIAALEEIAGLIPEGIINAE